MLVTGQAALCSPLQQIYTFTSLFVRVLCKSRFPIYVCVSVYAQQRLERQHCMRNGAIKFDCSRIVRLYTSSCGIRKSEMRLVIALVRIIIFLTRFFPLYIYIKFQIHRIFFIDSLIFFQNDHFNFNYLFLLFLSKIFFDYFTFFFPLASPKHISLIQ